MPSIDRHTLGELRDAMVAQARQWLTGDEAAARWSAFNREAFAAMLAAPLGELVDLKAASVALAAVQADAMASETIRPALRFALVESMSRMSQRGETLGELLGSEGRAAVLTLAGRPDVVDETLLRALAEDDAMVAAMKDVLYEALVQFADRVNPFVADWGLPRLLDQLPLFGKGTLRKAFDNARSDFDKRLEPEIKRFLKGFARQGTKQLVALLLDKGGEPELEAMRQHLAEIVLDQPLSELTWSVQEERGAQLSDTIVAALLGVLRHPTTGRQLERAWEELLGRWSTCPLGEVLGQLDIAPPDVGPFAVASWPAARAALTSEAALDGLAQAIDKAHEAWLAGR